MGGAAATRCASYTPTLKPNDYLRVGSPVEVCTNEEGWKDVFFTGTVYSHGETGGPKKRLKQVCIEYHDLLAEEGGSERLKECIEVEHVRPAPPFQEIWDRLETGDVVDAFYNDGWWMGSVNIVLKDGRVTVKFSNPPDEIEFGRADLRIHWDWVDGTWKRSASHRKSGSLFKVASSVEVSPGDLDKRDAWFPGRVLGIQGNGKHVVQYGDASNDSKAATHRTVVDSNFLRPPPPRLKYKKYELLEKIDAYYDSGWWTGVVTSLLEDGKVGVSLKQGKMEGEFKDSELRPRMEWVDGNWWILSQGHHSNGSDTGKGISFFDRIKSCTTSDGSLGSSQERFDATKRGTKSQAVKKNFRTFSPCLDAGTQSLNPEVKKPLLMNSSEKDAGNKNAAEVTEFPVITALPCEESGSGKTSNERSGHLSITQTASGDKQNAPKVVAMKKDNEQSGRKYYRKRKRGRTRKVQVKRMQTPGTSDLHKEDGPASTNPSLGWEDSTMEHENELQIKEWGICPSDANVTLGNNDKNSEVSDMLRDDTKVDMEEDEIPDFRNDEPLSEWIKTMHSPFTQNVTPSTISSRQVEKDCATEVATPENIGEQLKCAVQKEMQSTPKQDGIAGPSSTAAERDSSSEVATLKDIGEQLYCMVQNVMQSLSKQGGASAVPSSAASSPQMEKGSASRDSTPESVGEQLEFPVQITETAPHEEQNLPFVKTASLWRTIELMEVFQGMPQKPHFKPLEEFKEGLREGLAIGYMITFSSMVERTSKLQISDPESVEDELLDILTDLEKQGFDVTILQNRVSKLWELKQQHKKMIKEVNELNGQTLEDKHKATEIEEQIISNAKYIKELQAKQLELTAVKEKINQRIASRATRVKESEEGIKVTTSLFATIVSSSKEYL